MRYLLAAVTLCAVLMPVHADELPQATVEYSADSTMEAEGMRMHTRVYHTLDKERREVAMGGQQQVMILRMDKGLSWMLMSDSKQYMEMPVGAGLDSSSGFAGYRIERTAEEQERVNGLDTTRYRTVLTSPEGFDFEGFMWVTRRGLLVKMDAESKSPAVGGRIRMELTNIKIGPQDPALFEIPAGYTKFDMSGFGGVPEAP